uniref:PiggyBac transposable element-derived protein domain-containing protein n=1 Tax=Timema monikensis TaxID=170555 RepID=A0A7R9EBA4_9NEOP|nr:unnamed protein product [Timema monikensis]
MFFDDEVIELIANCSNNQAFQKGNIKLKVTVNDIKVFLGIHLLRGYSSVPRYRIYWETSKVCTRIDNLTLDENDKFGKVRPLWLLISQRWLRAFPKDSNLSIDEALVPYYSQPGAKQHIHGEPYQSASTGNTHPELGVGGSVVIYLVDKFPLGQYSIYIDKFFTSVRLLEELKVGATTAPGLFDRIELRKHP